ncbi:hypothetical protein [Bosea sp. (in: a-proteobacteria)]|uniref:hypothetical protein n=1 Tax=Bosea sp. (in: a-proteobacteria) TaxID=1871050 RepID=UPI003B3B4AF5
MSRTFAIIPGTLPVRIADPAPLQPGDGLGAVPATVDRLTDVTGEDLWRPSLRLFPRGRAWPDETVKGLGAFVWHGLPRLVAETMAQIHDWLNRARYGAFVSQCRPELVEDHEREVGLPDGCLAAVTGLPERRAMVLDAKAPLETANRLEIAASLNRAGFAGVAIDEPLGFEFGLSDLGGPEGFGSAGLPHIFLFAGQGLSLDWLTFGESGFEQLGFGQLNDTGLTCLIEKIRPAHTLGILDPESL